MARQPAPQGCNSQNMESHSSNGTIQNRSILDSESPSQGH